MFCKNCGTKIEGEMKFCPSCGTVVDNNAEENKAVLDSGSDKALDVAPTTSTIVNDNSQVNNSTNYQSTVTDNYSATSQNNYGMNSTSPQFPAGGMQQPMYNQPYVNPTNNGKKNNSVLFIIIGIVVAFVVCVGIIVYSNIKNDNNSNSNSNRASNSNSNIIGNSNSNSYSNSNVTSNYNSNVYSNSNVTSNYNSNVYSNSNTTTNNTITFKGYVFQIPSNYRSQTTSSQLQLIGTNNIDVAAINVQSGSFESIKASKETINSYMTNAGYTVKNIRISYYGGVEFVTAEVIQSGRNMILGYAKLNANTIFMVVTGNTNNVLNYNALNDIAPMITTARVAR